MKASHLRCGARSATMLASGGGMFLFGEAVLSGDEIDASVVLDAGLWVLLPAAVWVLAELIASAVADRRAEDAQVRAEMQWTRAELRKVRDELVERQPNPEEFAEEVASYMVFKALTGDGGMAQAVGDDTGTHNVTRFRPR